MKIINTTLVQFIMAVLFFANNSYAFEAVIPESAIFNFDANERITLEEYNDLFLASLGRYEEIEFDESDASFGARLILEGFSVEDCYRIAIAAYLPQKYHDKLPIPKKTGVTKVDSFSQNDYFFYFETKAEFNGDQLSLVEITLSQGGSDHVIQISPIIKGVQIEYLTSLP